MDQQADDIIAAIFEKAKNDERTAPVVDALRTALERDRWTPEALGAGPEDAITAKMRHNT